MYAMTCTRPDVSFALSMQTDKDDSHSQSGWVFLLNRRAVTWESLKQDIVADSTRESEYIAACEASKEAIWMKNFIGDLRVVPTVQDLIEIFYDNESAVALTKEPNDHEKLKHIERKYHFVRSKSLAVALDGIICLVNQDRLAPIIVDDLSKWETIGFSVQLGYRKPINLLAEFAAVRDVLSTTGSSSQKQCVGIGRIQLEVEEDENMIRVWVF
ncbi:hypothetical protein Tco_1575344 [Tanacetum coccineum]